MTKECIDKLKQLADTDIPLMEIEKMMPYSYSQIRTEYLKMGVDLRARGVRIRRNQKLGKLDAISKKEMQQLIDNRVHLKRIALRCMCSVHSVRNKCHEYDIEMKQYFKEAQEPKGSKSNFDVDLLKKGVKELIPLKDIAKNMGYSACHVSAMVRQHGIDMTDHRAEMKRRLKENGRNFADKPAKKIPSHCKKCTYRGKTQGLSSCDYSVITGKTRHKMDTKTGVITFIKAKVVFFI